MTNTLRTYSKSALLAAGLLLVPFATHAQQTTKPKTAEIEPRSAEGMKETPMHYTHEQLLTATVHQAWQLSDKNEANFFDMVEELAKISAANRGITLPESAAAGRRMGEYIKRTAKADTDQLLYAVVDKAVLMTAKTPVHAAGKKTAAAPAKD
jgi:hypothetical protein